MHFIIIKLSMLEVIDVVDAVVVLEVVTVLVQEDRSQVEVVAYHLETYQVEVDREAFDLYIWGSITAKERVMFLYFTWRRAESGWWWHKLSWWRWERESRSRHHMRWRWSIHKSRWSNYMDISYILIRYALSFCSLHGAPY